MRRAFPKVDMPPERHRDSGAGGREVNGTQSVASSSTSTSLADLDSSGWPSDPRERCDFYHRIRVFPSDVADWRKKTIARLLKDRVRFRALKPSDSADDVRALLDDGISQLREIARLASVLYVS